MSDDDDDDVISDDDDEVLTSPNQMMMFQKVITQYFESFAKRMEIHEAELFKRQFKPRWESYQFEAHEKKYLKP